MLTRILRCQQAGVPITNYGLAIAYSLGIFERALQPFPAALDIVRARGRSRPPTAGRAGYLRHDRSRRRRAADASFRPSRRPMLSPQRRHRRLRSEEIPTGCARTTRTRLDGSGRRQTPRGAERRRRGAPARPHRDLQPLRARQCGYCGTPGRQPRARALPHERRGDPRLRRARPLPTATARSCCSPARTTGSRREWIAGRRPAHQGRDRSRRHAQPRRAAAGRPRAPGARPAPTATCCASRPPTRRSTGGSTRPARATRPRPAGHPARAARLGYEIGSGVMVGIPGQTYESVAGDIELFRGSTWT